MTSTHKHRPHVRPMSGDTTVAMETMLLPLEGEGSGSGLDFLKRTQPSTEYRETWRGSLDPPTQEIQELQSSKRGTIFYWTWTLKGLVILVFVGFTVASGFFLPYWITGNGAEVRHLFNKVWMSESAAFFVGIVLSVLLGFLSLAVLLFTFYRRSAIVPKSCKRLLRSLVGGLPQGSMMISYTTRTDSCYEHEVPRRIGRLFPCRWLDEDSLLPGIPLKEACVEAAKNCMFGVMFVSGSYIWSEVCRVEFKTLMEGDKPNVLFLYPDAVAQLEIVAAGESDPLVALTEEQKDICSVLRRISEIERSTDSPCAVLRLSAQEARDLETNPAWTILRVLIQSGTFTRLFRTYTPLVFDEWRATALALSGFTNHSWYIGVFFICAWIVPIAFCAAGVYYTDTITRILVIVFNVPIFVLMCFVFKCMFSGIIGNIGYMAHLNDPICLLIVLRRLGIVRTTNVRLDGMHAALFAEIEKLGVISTTFDPSERHIYFCQAEKIAKGEDKCEGGPQRHLVTWRNNGFGDFHLLPECVHASWVHKAHGGLDYITMCSIILLFALDHQSLRGNTAGIRLSANATSKKKIK